MCKYLRINCSCISQILLEFALVTAEHDYHGENSDDLSFKTGDKIKVIERINLDWLMGECNGKRGLFPASFVEGLQNESSSTIQTSGKDIEQKVCCITIVVHWQNVFVQNLSCNNHTLTAKNF